MNMFGGGETYLLEGEFINKKTKKLLSVCIEYSYKDEGRRIIGGCGESELFKNNINTVDELYEKYDRCL